MIQVAPETQQGLQTLETLSLPSTCEASLRISQDEQGAGEPLEWNSQLSTSSNEITRPSTLHILATANTYPPSLPGSSPPQFSVGDVTLTAAQAREHFQRYFAQGHQYLPFKLKSQSPEEVYMKCSLLFWAVCAAASTWKLRSQLAGPIKAMVSESMYSPRSVEIVQALLILCVWPGTITSLSHDPSHLYSSMAVQMSLQLGLHQPSSYGCDSPDFASSSAAEVKLATWLACLIVGHMQASALGVPPFLTIDHQHLKVLDSPMVDVNLSRLCRIHHLLDQANQSLSSQCPTASGILDTGARLGMIRQFGEQFCSLREQYLGNMNNVVTIALLSAKVQLWSFAFFDDIPVSPELLKIVNDAKEDACEVIDLCYHRNLATAPYYVRRAMCYCAFVLVKFMRSLYHVQTEVLEDHIERVCQALSTSTCSQEDIDYKACNALRALPYIEDKKLSPPIASRMGASVVYDLLRIWAENDYGRTRSIEQDTQMCDLDVFDWTSFTL